VEGTETLDRARVLSQLERGLRQCNTLQEYYAGRGNLTDAEHFEGGWRALRLLAYWIGLEDDLDVNKITTYDEELIQRHERERGIS
jgi:hypothetical protein